MYQRQTLITKRESAIYYVVIFESIDLESDSSFPNFVTSPMPKITPHQLRPISVRKLLGYVRVRNVVSYALLSLYW